MDDRQAVADLGIIFKISERCNLKCSYCYFFFSGDETWKTRPPVVSPLVVAQLGEFCRRAAEKYSLGTVRVTFHGGEPLLMRRPKFEEMCVALRQYESSFKFLFSLQTNAALITDEWVDIFQRHRVSIGVSLDGVRSINDLHRVDMRGRSSYDRTIAGLEKLQEAAAAKRIPPPGILSVINPLADGQETFLHFVDDLGVRHIDFLLPDNTHDSAPDSGTLRGVRNFLDSALSAWIRRRDPRIKVRIFSHALSAIASHASAKLYETYGSDYRNLISVASDGSIGPEDTLHGAHERFRSMGLNIARHTIDDVLSSAVWDEQRRAAAERPDGCMDCDWWRACKGGKPVNRYSDEGGFNNPSIYCDSLQDMYATLSALLVRNGVPVARIAANLTA